MSPSRVCNTCLGERPLEDFIGRHRRPCVRCSACRTNGVRRARLTVNGRSPSPEAPHVALSTEPAVIPVVPPPAPFPTSLHSVTPDAVTDMVQSAVADLRIELSSSMQTTFAEFRDLLTQQTRPTPAPGPRTPPPTAPPPPVPGESYVDRLFPWLGRDVVTMVAEDQLAPQDLGRLKDPGNATAPASDAPAGVRVNGMLIESSAPGPANRHFTRQLPDALAFAQAWTVYAHLRAHFASDTSLGAALGSFLVHILELNRQYLWHGVADYVLSVCRRRFGHATSADWAARDHAVFQDHLGAFQVRGFRPTISTTSAGLPPGRQSRSDLAKQVCFRFNSPAGCSDSSCLRQHVCKSCRGSHSMGACNARTASAEKADAGGVQ
jgi:hypothetical protein